MSTLSPGQDVVISWSSGATDCQVIAAAGAFVLLRPDPTGSVLDAIPGACTLTFLDGMIPMGWDGTIHFGSEPGELRFQVSDSSRAADRRSAVRLPIFADVDVTIEGRTSRAQMLDISATGMRFRGPNRPRLGETISVRVQLPGGPAVDADGIVRLSEPGAVIAVEFTALRVGTVREIGAWTVAQLRQSLTARA
ncbi:MAG: PilZ domain [Solirubrobacteraceae bacterium]|jgi:hypothetical protein|nr:PilZ domain [Solirubrobacteraceae bacterium]